MVRTHFRIISGSHDPCFLSTSAEFFEFFPSCTLVLGIQCSLASMNNVYMWHFSNFNGNFSFKKLSLVQNVSNTQETLRISVYESITWPTKRWKACCDVRWIPFNYIIIFSYTYQQQRWCLVQRRVLLTRTDSRSGNPEPSMSTKVWNISFEVSCIQQWRHFRDVITHVFVTYKLHYSQITIYA